MLAIINTFNTFKKQKTTQYLHLENHWSLYHRLGGRTQCTGTARCLERPSSGPQKQGLLIAQGFNAALQVQFG